MFYIPYPFKKCHKCERELLPNTNHFPRARKNKDGLFNWCKECNRAHCKEKYDKDPEYHRLRVKIYYENHAEERKKYAQKQYKIRENELRIWRRDYYRKNADKIRAVSRSYQRSHPKLYRIHSHKREARKRELPDTFTINDWRRALRYFNGCCAVCGRTQGLWHTLAMDHWIPLSSPHCPGTIPTNIIPLCHGADGCNNSKNNAEPNTWLTQRFGKRKGRIILKRIEDYFDSLG